MWCPLRVFEGLYGCPCWCSNHSLASLARFVIVSSNFVGSTKIESLFLQTSNARSLTKGHFAPLYHSTRQKTRSLLPLCKAQHHTTPFRHYSERFFTALKNRHIILRTSNDCISSLWRLLRGVRRVPGGPFGCSNSSLTSLTRRLRTYILTQLKNKTLNLSNVRSSLTSFLHSL